MLSSWVGEKSLLFSGLVAGFFWDQSLCIFDLFFWVFCCIIFKLLGFLFGFWGFLLMWLGFDEISGFGDMGCL